MEGREGNAVLAVGPLSDVGFGRESGTGFRRFWDVGFVRFFFRFGLGSSEWSGRLWNRIDARSEIPSAIPSRRSEKNPRNRRFCDLGCSLGKGEIQRDAGTRTGSSLCSSDRRSSKGKQA